MTNTKQLFLYLADDDDEDRLLFSDALLEIHPEGKIDTFDNGVDLMAALLNTNIALPDIIFLDLNMPLMNGEECLNDIKNESELSGIPIIIYSGYFDEEKVDLLHKKGANLYLQKPVTFPHLQALLDRAIQSIMSKEPESDFVIR